MPTEKFTCSQCGEESDRDLDNTETLKELEENFPGEKPENCDIVCDDCYMAYIYTRFY